MVDVMKRLAVHCTLPLSLKLLRLALLDHLKHRTRVGLYSRNLVSDGCFLWAIVRYKI